MEVDAAFKKQVIHGNDAWAIHSHDGQSADRHTFQQEFHFPGGLHCPILAPWFCSHSCSPGRVWITQSPQFGRLGASGVGRVNRLFHPAAPVAFN
jgi:hypothetical protein